MIKECKIRIGINSVKLKNYGISDYNIKIINFEPSENKKYSLKLKKFDNNGNVSNYECSNPDIPIPNVFFRLFRDGKTNLEIESDITGIIQIQYEQIRHIIKDPKILSAEKKKENDTIKYYYKYFKSHGGAFMINDEEFSKFEYLDEDKQIFNLFNKQRFDEIYKDDDNIFSLPRGYDILKGLIITSKNISTCKIIGNGVLLASFIIMLGKNYYPFKMFTRKLAYQQITIEFEPKVVTEIQYDGMNLPHFIKEFYDNTVALIQQYGKNHIYMNNMIGLLEDSRLT